MKRTNPRTTLFPYTTLFRSRRNVQAVLGKIPGKMKGKLPVETGHKINQILNRSRAVILPRNDQTGYFQVDPRSEEHTSELQSRPHLVCRLLLEKKKANSGDH